MTFVVTQTLNESDAARDARRWLLWLPLELALDMGLLLPLHIEINVYSL